MVLRCKGHLMASDWRYSPILLKSFCFSDQTFKSFIFKEKGKNNKSRFWHHVHKIWLVTCDIEKSAVAWLKLNVYWKVMFFLKLPSFQVNQFIFDKFLLTLTVPPSICSGVTFYFELFRVSTMFSTLNFETLSNILHLGFPTFASLPMGWSVTFSWHP